MRVLMRNEVNDFMFVDMGGLRIELNPTVPQWLIDMPLIHPNDIRTLVKLQPTL